MSPKQKLQFDLRRLGACVRRQRIERRVTQEALAELADLNIRTVQKIEAGQINVLITTVMRIQGALNCRWDDLLPQS